MAATITDNTINTNKKLYLLRGISGSGKSTLSRTILQTENILTPIVNDEDETHKQIVGKHILSTDDYFVNRQTGRYEFEGAKIGRAHEWNQNRVKQCMSQSQSIIIVDNTNTQRWEAKPYVVLAQEFGYEVIVREPDTPWRRNAAELAKRNVHGVPVEAIQRMLDRWDEDFSVETILKSAPPKRRGPPRGNRNQ